MRRCIAQNHTCRGRSDNEETQFWSPNEQRVKKMNKKKENNCPKFPQKVSKNTKKIAQKRENGQKLAKTNKKREMRKLRDTGCVTKGFSLAGLASIHLHLDP